MCRQIIVIFPKVTIRSNLISDEMSQQVFQNISMILKCIITGYIALLLMFEMAANDIILWRKPQKFTRWPQQTRMSLITLLIFFNVICLTVITNNLTNIFIPLTFLRKCIGIGANYVEIRCCNELNDWSWTKLSVTCLLKLPPAYNYSNYLKLITSSAYLDDVTSCNCTMGNAFGIQGQLD